MNKIIIKKDFKKIKRYIREEGKAKGEGKGKGKAKTNSGGRKGVDL